MDHVQTYVNVLSGTSVSWYWLLATQVGSCLGMMICFDVWTGLQMVNGFNWAWRLYRLEVGNVCKYVDVLSLWVCLPPYLTFICSYVQMTNVANIFHCHEHFDVAWLWHSDFQSWLNSGMVCQSWSWFPSCSEEITGYALKSNIHS